MHQVRLQAAKLRVMGRPIDAGVDAEGEERANRGEEEEEGVVRAWRTEEAIRGRRREKCGEPRGGVGTEEESKVTSLGLPCACSRELGAPPHWLGHGPLGLGSSSDRIIFLVRLLLPCRAV